ncbi:MAG: hypothetical protein ACW97A_04095 [Candidatus Thorarchaeota archaeon]
MKICEDKQNLYIVHYNPIRNETCNWGRSKNIVDTEDLLQRHSSNLDRLGDAVGSSDVFERQFGAELAHWERTLLSGFRSKLSGKTLRCRGFVHHTGDDSLVFLTPSPWLSEGTFVYLRSDQEVPPEGSFIEIVGRSITAPEPLGYNQTIVRAITAESLENKSIDDIIEVKPPMKLKELSGLLFENVGMAEASKRVFTQLFVSSPSFQNSVGGLTAGIQAIASRRKVQRLLSFMRSILPPTMRNRTRAEKRISGINIALPKLWRLDVGTLGPSRMESLCVKRQDPSGFKEVSLGALTNSDTASLPDVPIALTSEDFWVEVNSRKASHLRLPIIKSAITFQLKTPQIATKSIDAITKHVLIRLEQLKESFGLDDSSLARGHLLDGDALGRPLSTIRLARSTARAMWKDKVNAKDLKTSWNRILEPALKEFIELTELKSGVEKDWGKGARVDQFNTKVLRALKKLDSGQQGSLGPTLEEIAAEASVERHVAAETLTRMKDSGAIYEPRTGHFRLV